ncbi:hypothetical protein [Polyangium mundeleinium]|uniref:Uncharacterized protein n=1 Tax=Polyangium mundeleinium TaxID=2995306 RepID=A0ABT5EHX1_9BACT|nr:hypothetical protein [Polyangium mundeleinium]MDC0740977.1 hypothetical protein [Polyangium mundeleinium]
MLDKDEDLKKLKQAWEWFRSGCGKSVPEEPNEWKACFDALSKDVDLVLRNAIAACEALDSAEDGPRLISELSRRLDRNWDGYRFDEYVVGAAKRLGYDRIDVVQFRNRHLDKWRKVVAAADDGCAERLVTQRIEADMLDMMSRALPAPSSEIIDKLQLKTPLELTVLMLALRVRAPIYAEDLAQALDLIGAELARVAQREQGPTSS